jgi:chromosome partitioning protein
MAKIITIAHQKGGVGKTTLAINLAYCFKDSLRVGLVDLDLQGSLLGLRSTLKNLNIEQRPKSLQDIARLPYDLILADTPPYLSKDLPEIFLASDYILVPTKAGFLDVMAIKGTLQLVREAQKAKPQLKAGIVLNMIKLQTGLTADIVELLNSYELTVLESMITDRVSYTRSAVLGGVVNMEDSKAKNEILLLADEIFTEMGF